MDPEDLHYLDKAPLVQDEPPQFFIDLAAEVAEEYYGDARCGDGERRVQLDPLTIISLASLLFSIFKYCKQERIIRVVNRAAKHPHGIAAMRLRAKLSGHLTKLEDQGGLAEAIVTVADRRIKVPGIWAAAGSQS